jgi:hypothetical protein
MQTNKDNLVKLIDFIIELTQFKENKWFKDDLSKRLMPSGSLIFSNSHIDEIYEYCLQNIIKEHAERFYADFNLVVIKAKLIDDFIRMEKFRRDDNFEDFCLAAYQQIESIINILILSPEFINYFKENKDLAAILNYDITTKTFVRRGNQKIGKLIFLNSDNAKVDSYLNSSIQSWFFNHKFRAVLYYYYFNKEIKVNTQLFERIYDIGNFLYQGRNLNHRGILQSKYQQNIIDDLIPNQHKYYFRFLGFLEDFISSINKNI